MLICCGGLAVGSWQLAEVSDPGHPQGLLLRLLPKHVRHGATPIRAPSGGQASQDTRGDGRAVGWRRSVPDPGH